jgi:hypothetical protein
LGERWLEAEGHGPALVGGEELKEEARAAAANGRDGIELGLGNLEGVAQPGEELTKSCAVGLVERCERCPTGDALSNRPRRIGHGADKGTSAWEEGAKAIEASASEDGHNELATGKGAVGRVEPSKDLGLAGDDHGLGIGKEGLRRGGEPDAKLL